MNKTPEGISMSFLKTAKRLPRKGGKIVLDRNNPEHVSWTEEFSNCLIRGQVFEIARKK
ncbi:hypothetical protein NST69_18020 [Paenibacillus sp. FSL P2-0089]|uniref:SOS-response transcriptional repressor LexA n=1 Tax=Paenibacillus silagei TaxID=1670801 RepID=A0ABS4NM76_9BACL|nr:MULTISPECIES: hypothetical protein [Paenibacillus]MBP2110586.1 SOS-response transcriptional repressor LexA [Paenibacillus silagei]